ncbi:MAG: hypothetical protein RL148_371 [Planctomycetota bacterium]|jgi:uncharacterized protein involved in exopolysaccharide biosynthesis
MTQLELPQVSLAHYADLVKRRRWQIIPGSLLGLLLGGLVAMLIPRYYVAEAIISHTRDPGNPRIGTPEDPMAEMVALAKARIPLLVGTAMRQLNWPEGLIAEPFKAIEAEREVRLRLEVQDQNPSKVRSYARLRLTYKDRQGKRAADLLNALVDIWTKDQLQSLQASAARSLAAANDQVEREVAAFANASTELRELERNYGLQPNLRPEDAAGVAKQMEADRAKDERELVAAQAKRESLQKEIARLQAELDGTPRRVAADAETRAAQLADPRLGPMIVQMTILKASLERVLGPAHPLRATRERELAALQQQVQDLGAAFPTDPAGATPGEKPNPRWTELRGEIAASQSELATVSSLIEALSKALVDRALRNESLAVAWHEHRQLYELQEEARKRRDLAQIERDKIERSYGQIANERPINIEQPAFEPPRPTDPNVLLVALVGSIVGLGVAVGSILLIDMLQGTFKSVEEVESALGVPYLGGVSHLVTEEIRAKEVRSRKRFSLVSVVLLVLVLVVVTIYYLDPTHLPGFARELLAVLVGDG